MRVLPALLIVCLSLATAQYFSSAFTSPLFMWSNTKFFVGKNVQVNEMVSTEDVLGSIKGVSSPMGKYFSQERALPEVIVIFVEPELRTEQFPLLANSYASQPNGGAFSKLKGTLESYASSSVVVSYSHSSFGQTIGSTIASLSSQGMKVTVAKKTGSSILSELDGRTDVNHVTLEQLTELASSNWEILSNGVPDLIVVGFDSPVVRPGNVELVSASYNADDTYMNSFLHSIGRSTYVALFTAEKSATESVKQARAYLSLEQLGASNGDSIFPPEVIEALIVMLPFLLILYIGVSCTSSVQSVLKFDAELDVRRK